MEDRQHIERLFKEALEHHEVEVRPEVWSNLQQSLVSTSATTSAAGASASLTKVAVAAALAGLATFATVNEVRYHQAQSAQPEQTIAPADQDDQHNTAAADYALPDQRQNSEPSSVAREVQKEVTETSSEPRTSTELQNAHQEAPVERSSERVAAGNASELQVGIDHSEQTPNTQEPSAATTQNRAAARQETAKGQDAATENRVPVVQPKEEMAASSNPAPPKEEEPQTTVARFSHEALQTITPNGDMYNEYFEVEGKDVAEFSIRIMTREGAVVFESRDINFKWNGLDRFGNPVPTGTYFYQIAAVGTDGLPYTEKNARGSIQVIRN